MSRDRLLASAFFSNTNIQAERISLAVVDFTHFKRKRSIKIDRATFCTEWKSTLTVTLLIMCIKLDWRSITSPFRIYPLSEMPQNPN